MDNNNVNKLTNKKIEIMRDKLAIELMEKLDKKYNMSNMKIKFSHEQGASISAVVFFAVIAILIFTFVN